MSPAKQRFAAGVPMIRQRTVRPRGKRKRGVMRGSAICWRMTYRGESKTAGKAPKRQMLKMRGFDFQQLEGGCGNLHPGA